MAPHNVSTTFSRTDGVLPPVSSPPRKSCSSRVSRHSVGGRRIQAARDLQRWAQTRRNCGRGTEKIRKTTTSRLRCRSGHISLGNRTRHRHEPKYPALANSSIGLGQVQGPSWLAAVASHPSSSSPNRVKTRAGLYQPWTERAGARRWWCLAGISLCRDVEDLPTKVIPFNEIPASGNMKIRLL